MHMYTPLKTIYNNSGNNNVSHIFSHDISDICIYIYIYTSKYSVHGTTIYTYIYVM